MITQNVAKKLGAEGVLRATIRHRLLNIYTVSIILNLVFVFYLFFHTHSSTQDSHKPWNVIVGNSHNLVVKSDYKVAFETDTGLHRNISVNRNFIRIEGDGKGVVDIEDRKVGNKSQAGVHHGRKRGKPKDRKSGVFVKNMSNSSEANLNQHYVLQVD